MTEKTEALNFRIETDLKAAFLAACKANDVNAAQVLRAAAREYVARQKPEAAALKAKGSKP